MSYCRWGESDVYIYHSTSGTWDCLHIDEPNFYGKNREAMLEHIAKHRKKGDYVPESVDQRLREEIEAGEQHPQHIIDALKEFKTD